MFTPPNSLTLRAQTSGHDESNASQQIVELHAHTLLMKVNVYSSHHSFQHVTTSPYHLVQPVVQTITLISETDNLCLTLLSYRATTLPCCKLSPSELLMGRRVRTDVPQPVKSLTPNWAHLTAYAQKDREYNNQQRNFDKRHRACPLPPLPERTTSMGEHVRTPGTRPSGQTFQHSTLICS